MGGKTTEEKGVVCYAERLKALPIIRTIFGYITLFRAAPKCFRSKFIKKTDRREFHFKVKHYKVKHI